MDLTTEQNKILAYFTDSTLVAKPRNWVMGATIMITDPIDQERVNEDPLIYIGTKLAYAMGKEEKWVVWTSDMLMEPYKEFDQFDEAMQCIDQYFKGS